MPTTARVKISSQAIDELERDLAGIANGVPRAMSAALNDTVRHTKTAIIKRMQGELTLKRQSIAEVVSARLTDAKSDPMEATVTLSDRKRPLHDFKFTKSSKGITVQVRKGKKEKFRHRFVASVKATSKGGEVSHHLGIFNRVKGRDKFGKLTGGRVAGKGKNKRIVGRGFARRLPIKEVHGPSVTAVFTEAPGVMQEEVDKADAYLAERLRSKADYLLKRRKTDR